jgi:hypothetical protein
MTDWIRFTLDVLQTSIPVQAETHHSADRAAEEGPRPTRGGSFSVMPAMSPEAALQVPSDEILADELSREDMVEMANLTTALTGIAGTILISTAMGAHGPRVKYFVRPGRTEPSFSVSIADWPAVVANGLSERIVRQMGPQVVAWVALNRGALLDFWNHGDTWTQPEASNFIQGLRRL